MATSDPIVGYVWLTSPFDPCSKLSVIPLFWLDNVDSQFVDYDSRTYFQYATPAELIINHHLSPIAPCGLMLKTTIGVSYFIAWPVGYDPIYNWILPWLTTLKILGHGWTHLRPWRCTNQLGGRDASSPGPYSPHRPPLALRPACSICTERGRRATWSWRCMHSEWVATCIYIYIYIHIYIYIYSYIYIYYIQLYVNKYIYIYILYTYIYIYILYN